jgi:hypothetical protein
VPNRWYFKRQSSQAATMSAFGKFSYMILWLMKWVNNLHTIICVELWSQWSNSGSYVLINVVKIMKILDVLQLLGNFLRFYPS